MRVVYVFVTLSILLMLCTGCTISQPSRSVSQTPSHELSDAMSPSVSPTINNETPTESAAVSQVPIVFNEDDFTQYFQFGMSLEAVENKLDEIGISNSKTADLINDGYWWINTVNARFYVDNNDHLYSISFNNRVNAADTWPTAKGLKTGDSVDKIDELYGQADEVEKTFEGLNTENRVYHMDGYYFSISTVRVDNDKYEVDGWSVFVDIWNEPNVFSADANGIATVYGSDSGIMFTEENYSQYFQFGMSQQEVETKLNDLKIRIVQEYEMDDDQTSGWVGNSGAVITDHIYFLFYDDQLDSITVRGWDTAKGLREGDSEDRLHKLYGKEDNREEKDLDKTEYTFYGKKHTFLVIFYSFPQEVFYWKVYTDDFINTPE